VFLRYAPALSWLAPDMPGSNNISFEVVKLLLQVAWSDHEASPNEAEGIMQFAKRHDLDEVELAAVSAALFDRAPLPVPDLGTLKAHRVRVLGELKELLESDLGVSHEEEAMLRQISQLLD
jgi:uncharacterized tellurite resistance protein B-like protein